MKVFGNDLDQIQKVSEEVAEVLSRVPGAVDIVPDQIKGKGYLEIVPDREKAARYGVNVGDIWDVVEVALGGRADHDDGRRPRAVPRPRALRPQVPPGRGGREEPAHQRCQRRRWAKPRAAK